MVFAHFVSFLYEFPEDPCKVFLPSEFTFGVTQGAVFLVDCQSDSFCVLPASARTMQYVPWESSMLAKRGASLVPLQGDEGGFHHALESVSLSPQRTRKVEGSSGSPCPLMVGSTRFPCGNWEGLVATHAAKYHFHPCKSSALSSLVRELSQGCDDFHCAPSAL